jgi:hippurate hydrolase
MIDDGLLNRFPKPDVVLGQHVMVGPAGNIGGRGGTITSAADSLQIRLFGRGAHGSMPQASINPVIMAAATVMRLQTIVSRELAAAEPAVVTIGALQAGTKENVIPDEAVIKLNVRTFDAGVRKRVLAAIERIANAEAAASGAPRPPEITHWNTTRWGSTMPMRAPVSPMLSASISQLTACGKSRRYR